MSLAKPAVKQSKAFDRFEATIQRSLNLITLHEAMSKLAAKTPHKALRNIELNDLVRAAIVLAVAAMDSYFTDVFAEKLIPFLTRRNSVPKDMVNLLCKAGLDTKAALEMLKMQKPYRRVRTLLESHFEAYTTQKFEVVDGLFLAYGIKALSGNVEKKAGRKNLLKRVKFLIQRRHQIVHEGDLNDHGRLRTIAASDYRKRITDLCKLIGGTEVILYNRCK